MKIAITFFILLNMVLTSTLAIGQTTMKSDEYLLNKIQQKVADYENLKKKVIRIEVGTIQRDSALSIFRELTVGQSYEIIGFSDPDEIQDIDLYVYRRGQIEIRDQGTSPEARILFQPAVDDTYEILIRGLYYKEPYTHGRYSLIITTAN